MADILVSEYKGLPAVAAYVDNRLEFLSLIHDSDLGSIYLCRVDNLVKNLSSAFVKFGDEAVGYVPMKHILPAAVVNRQISGIGAVRSGDEVILQVETDSLKTKKAKLTSYISVPGRYSVVTLGRTGVGASLKLSSEKRDCLIKTVKEEFERLAGDWTDKLFGESFGIIIRTEAADIMPEQQRELILKDIEEALEELSRILREGRSRTVYSCIRPGEAKDLESHITKASNFLKSRGITDYGTLESSVIYSLGADIDKLSQSRVWLKSGGYIIIEQLESFNAIDVNTGKAVDGKNNPSEKVNLEAADEIIRQIRLRNLTGMILIDFINLKNSSDSDKLCEHVRQLCRKEPVRTEFIDMTGLGIVELTRNKNDKSLKEILKNLNQPVDKQ